jgi:hypothetical protein
MRSSHFDYRGGGPARATAPAAAPTTCPACRSTEITSVTRTPDENAYWRCDRCGEIWNAGRRNPR